MGHREDLLIGAKRCLIEKGYGRTTTRDIVAASGANLASIGYHYGSKEALLNAALLEALDDTGQEIQPTEVADSDPDAPPVERFEAAWTQIVEKYTTRRQLLLASFEVFAQVDRVPELQSALADGIEQGRRTMMELFKSIAGETAGDLDEESLKAVGAFFQALATGVMAQWLVDPDRAPSGHDLTLALRAMLTWSEAKTPEAAQA
ncbi:TetR/AcrR family transcriptional regulator [Streptomyces sp. NPDC008313]|uniref:TetR/AcrR family transcriptional regulator n=1 Tax=Streptomyces sp. NPDC008313 TaxID=3364826 RepID=UPI0036E5840E